MTKPKSPGSLIDAKTRSNLIRTCPVKREKVQGPKYCDTCPFLDYCNPTATINKADNQKRKTT